MGMFKDIRKLQKQAKEIDKTWDPGAQAQDAIARMKAMNQQMESQNAALAGPPGDAVEASGQIVSVGYTTGMVNMEQLMPVEFLVTQPGMPPRPVSATIMVPMNMLHRVVPGSVLPLRISSSNPAAVAVDWAAPA